MSRGRPPKEHGPPPDVEVVRNWTRLGRFLGIDRVTVRRRVQDPADPLSEIVRFDCGDREKPFALRADLERFVRTSPRWNEAG